MGFTAPIIFFTVVIGILLAVSITILVCKAVSKSDCKTSVAATQKTSAANKTTVGSTSEFDRSWTDAAWEDSQRRKWFDEQNRIAREANDRYEQGVWRDYAQQQMDWNSSSNDYGSSVGGWDYGSSGNDWNQWNQW